MRRRDLLALVAGAMAGWPRGARAQQQRLPIIGFLHSGSPGPFAHLAAAFRDTLQGAGYAEGQNVAIDFRWAEGQYGVLPGLAAELVRGQVAVIVAGGGGPAVVAAKSVTRTIPIVFVSGGDPVKMGLVVSLSRPGGNVTGINIFTATLNAKRFGLLHDLMPAAKLVAVLVNPSSQSAGSQVTEIQQAASSIGQSIHIAKATSEAEIEAVFASFAGIHPDALLVSADPFFNSRRNQIVVLAERHGLPGFYEEREYVLAGGLISYGTNLAEAYRQAAFYTARVLSGEKPAELPVFQVSKFELVINLRAAKALGLTVAPVLLAQADEVIE